MVQLESQATPERARKMGARQIYEALKDQILSQVYQAGGQLPSSRNLSNELGVSRTTVTVAYVRERERERERKRKLACLEEIRPDNPTTTCQRLASEPTRTTFG
ncbi:GntR family transcriptional regulator, partial [Rhizobium mongolense]|uniref:GntR family transcriptional regulator n=1 Tax=Rhizobium mongolense TaxID=57676 RepID=UPI00355785C0